MNLSSATLMPERPLLAFFLLLLVAALGWMWLRSFERSNLYFPEREIVYFPKAYGLPYEEVWLAAKGGPQLNAWFLPAKAEGLTLLFCHGNGGNISHRLEKARRLIGLGLNIFLFDYAGYGQSEGRPSEQATYRDAEAAYAHLVETRGIPPEKIVLYGESLGAAVAVELALRRPCRALILESPFTSTVAMGEHLLPWLPVRFMVRTRYDNLAKIPRVKVPLLILHSPDDDIVPYAMGRALYEAARSEKKFIELKGGHNDGTEAAGPIYTEAIRKFVELKGSVRG